MTIRRMRESDIPAIREMYSDLGFEYEFPDLNGWNIETVLIVADQHDRPVMACAAERIVQLYLFASKRNLHPAAAQYAIRILHDAMIPELRALGYHEANAFLPPQIESSFGRRLMRVFGWVKNWPSFCKRF